MDLTLYQIDAFATELFEGNPAAVCPLDEWLSDHTMQSIASENNLSETAFYVPIEDGFHIRWFTPIEEVDLCGHATLATAYVLFNLLGYQGDEVGFDSRSGRLIVTKEGDRLVMDFPKQPPVPCELPDAIRNAFDVAPVECLKAEDYIVVFEHESDVESAAPNFGPLAELDLRGVIITAPSSRYDFVARFLPPSMEFPKTR